MVILESVGARGKHHQGAPDTYEKLNKIYWKIEINPNKSFSE